MSDADYEKDSRLRLQPFVEGDEGLQFAVAAQAGERVCEHVACQHRQRGAGWRFGIVVMVEAMNGQRFAVKAPDFWNTERRIDRQFSERAVMHVDFDGDVG